MTLVESAPVANIKSQIKRNRQNEGRQVRNKSVKSSLKTSAKKVQTAVLDGDGDALSLQLRRATRELDQAASKGTIHKRAAARRKSRLARGASTAESH